MSFRERVLGIPQSKNILGVIMGKGYLGAVTMVIAVMLALYHIYTSFAGTPHEMLHRGVHVYAILMVVYLTTYARRKSLWYRAISLLAIVLSAGLLVFVMNQYDQMSVRWGSPTQLDLVLSAISILLIVEAVRRIIGPAMAGLIVFFLLYARFGLYFPGEVRHAGFRWGQILDLQFLSLDGIFTIPIGVMSTYIIIFLIFAGLLVKSGALESFINLAIRVAGWATGGPAKVAVIASTLMGMCSGAAAANVVVTGNVSIPLMKRLGYKPEFAGAVEACASSGGQFMPPIMGASAFIIAAILGIPYIEVCMRAAIPALLWFLAVFIVVHLEAKRLGLKPLSPAEIPSTKTVLQGLYLFIPIIALVYFLVIGYSPMYAGAIAFAMLFVLTFVRRETRLTVGRLLDALEHGIRMALPVAIACAGAGVIIGCVMQTGLGFYLSAALVHISGGQLLLLLPLVLVASLILGMGMVTVGAYIIVAILVSPALIEMGLPPIAAHLFPFYFAIISAITPPVAVASYTAAGIADANPWQTGVIGIRLAIPALIIPFIFVIQPSLLLIGSPLEILITTIASVLAVLSLAAVTVGYLLRKLNVLERIALFAVAVMFIFPNIGLQLAGLAVLAFIILLQKGVQRRRA